MGIIIAFLIAGALVVSVLAWPGPTPVSRDAPLRRLDDEEFAVLCDHKRRAWLTRMGYVSVVSLAPVPFYVLHRTASGPRAEAVVNLVLLGAISAVPSVIRLLLGGPRQPFPPLPPEEEQHCRELFDNRFFKAGERPCPRCGEP